MKEDVMTRPPPKKSFLDRETNRAERQHRFFIRHWGETRDAPKLSDVAGGLPEILRRVERSGTRCYRTGVTAIAPTASERL